MHVREKQFNLSMKHDIDYYINDRWQLNFLNMFLKIVPVLTVLFLKRKGSGLNGSKGNKVSKKFGSYERNKSLIS